MNNAGQQHARFIRENLDRPLILIGMMGAGKSRIGRALAQAIDRPFRDADEVIEVASGMTIGEIFTQSGEAYFRDLEQRTIRRLLDEPSCVIAAGGGALTRPETALAVKERAISIWVRAETSVILDRVARQGNRPMLRGGNPAGILDDLMAARLPLYRQADLTIDNDDQPVADILPPLLESIASFIGVNA